jgi:hypothetical protein
MPVINCKTGEVTHSAEELLELQKPYVPPSITRRQCALQLLNMGMITADEALAMVKTATVPAAIDAILSKTFSGEQITRAHIDFAAENYYRDNALLALMGMTPEQLDQFFIAAAQL